MAGFKKNPPTIKKTRLSRCNQPPLMASKNYVAGFGSNLVDMYY